MVTEEEIEYELSELMKENHRLCNKIGRIMRMVADYSKENHSE